MPQYLVNYASISMENESRWGCMKWHEKCLHGKFLFTKTSIVNCEKGDANDQTLLTPRFVSSFSSSSLIHLSMLNSVFQSTLSGCRQVFPQIPMRNSKRSTVFWQIPRSNGLLYLECLNHDGCFGVRWKCLYLPAFSLSFVVMPKYTI